MSFGFLLDSFFVKKSNQQKCDLVLEANVLTRLHINEHEKIDTELLKTIALEMGESNSNDSIPNENLTSFLKSYYDSVIKPLSGNLEYWEIFEYKLGGHKIVLRFYGEEFLYTYVYDVDGSVSKSMEQNAIVNMYPPEFYGSINFGNRYKTYSNSIKIYNYGVMAKNNEDEITLRFTKNSPHNGGLIFDVVHSESLSSEVYELFYDDFVNKRFSDDFLITVSNIQKTYSDSANKD